MTSRDDLLRAMSGQVWALDRRLLDQLLLAGSVEELRQAAAARSRANERRERPTQAVIPIMGPLSRRSSLWSDLFGGTSTAEAGAFLEAALADDSIDRVILLVDSPGGTVSGTPELAAAIRRGRDRKPIVAAVDGLAASAALWIAAQASAVVAAPSSLLGSVGVFSIHVDETAALDRLGIKPTIMASSPEKVEWSPAVKFSDSARAFEQAQINKTAEWFIDDLALGRRVSRSTVRERFGNGRMLTARDAVAAGMADGLGTFEEVLAAPPYAFERERRLHAGTRQPTRFEREHRDRAAHSVR